METAVTPQLGQRLKDRRVELGWSLRGLEERCGVHNSLIARIEAGQVKDPALDKLRRICDALEISATELLIEDGQLDSPPHRHLLDLITPHLPDELIGQLREHYAQQLAQAARGGEET